MSEEYRAPNPVTRLFGVLLITAGVLIMLLTGLCSGVVLIASIGSMVTSHAYSGFGSGVLVVALFGGLPFVFGAALFIFGRQLIRRPTPPAGPPVDLKTFD